MSTQTFKLDVQFTFGGEVYIKAEGRAQAADLVKNYFYMNTSSGFHVDPTRDELKVGNFYWDFDSTAEQKIVAISPVAKDED